MTKPVKIIFFALLFILMLSMTIYASNHQNLFTEFDWSGSPEWFQATIVDFYINQLILWLWVVKIENKLITKFLWLVLFVCFGGMGTAGYIIIRLIQNKPLLRKE